MKRHNLQALVVLNIALLVVLAVLCLVPSQAEAQFGGRRAGDYIMLAGTIPGRTTNAIYITDLNNGAMMAVQYDLNKRAIVALGARDLNQDFAAIEDRR